jgi:uncharacterized protein (DUF58 family)
MTRNMQLAVALLIAIGLVLAVILNPLIVGYVFAGGALAVVAVMTGIRIGRAIGDWRLEHGWGGHHEPRPTGKWRRPA